MTESRGVWAYAISDQGAGTDLSWLSGVADTPVQTVRAGELTVLASDVDLDEFGEAALRRNLENMAWLENVARAHHHVVDAAARLFPLLPARLATVYSSPAVMVEVLSRRCPQLRAALRRVSGRLEWGVKAYAAEDADLQDGAAAHSPAPAPAAAASPASDTASPAIDTAGPASHAAGGAGGSGAGLAYLRRRRERLAAREDSWHTAVTSARRLHAELSGHAALARLHPPQAPALSGSRSPMLLNAAYLLDADGATGFGSAVAAAASARPELRVELTGPWPPYSFAGETDC